MTGLALLGAGVGLFTSPNNSAVIAAAPAERIGQAGGILNTMRSFGTSFGVAAAAAVPAWQLGVTTGRTGDTLHAPPQALLGAAHEVLAMFALLAGALSAIRAARPGRPRRAPVRSYPARFRRLLTRSSTTPGSANVETSPNV